MSDSSPFAPWRRFLAAPNDSRGKMLAMAFLVSAGAALAVSSAAVLLGPRLDANRVAAQQARLEAMLADLPALADMLSGSGTESLEILVADLGTGTLADVDPAAFDAAALGPEDMTALSPDADLAGIGTRPDLAPIYVARQDGALSVVVLPVEGQGYQSRIKGFLALNGDLETVAGLTITEQGETPGLGANIQTDAWQAQWPGTQLYGPDGDLAVAVVRGSADEAWEVDAITGATRTSNGVQNMIRFWLGPDGFGPVLDALEAGTL